jgi:hypothetical protein
MRVETREGLCRDADLNDEVVRSRGLPQGLTATRGGSSESARTALASPARPALSPGEVHHHRLWAVRRSRSPDPDPARIGAAGQASGIYPHLHRGRRGPQSRRDLQPGWAPCSRPIECPTPGVADGQRSAWPAYTRAPTARVAEAEGRRAERDRGGRGRQTRRGGHGAGGRVGGAGGDHNGAGDRERDATEEPAFGHTWLLDWETGHELHTGSHPVTRKTATERLRHGAAGQDRRQAPGLHDLTMYAELDTLFAPVQDRARS